MITRVQDMGKVGTRRVNYQAMSSEQRLEFCRTGYAPDEFILRRLVADTDDRSVWSFAEQEEGK